MATNKYFSQGRRSEQLLYEDLIVESLKMYGQDVYYMPREIVNKDTIFQDDIPSRFDNAYKIEMYIENTEGFDGEGDLFAKFGVEIRDAATFVVSRRRWLSVVAPYENDIENNKPFFRPREGDLIFLPLSGSIFEIQKTFDETPFYQLKNLPVFRLSCELFEYSDEDFDTGIESIDQVENFAYQYVLSFDDVPTSNGQLGIEQYSYTVGEKVIQDNGSYIMTGDVVEYDASDVNNRLLSVAHTGSSDGQYRSWSTSNPVIGQTSFAAGIPIVVTEQTENINDGFQNNEFDVLSNTILDFSESNPFGDP